MIPAPAVDEKQETDDLRALRAARTRARRLIAPDGIEWRIYELDSPYDRRGSSLVFESDNVIRRVRLYPSGWRALPDDDLFELSGHA